MMICLAWAEIFKGERIKGKRRTGAEKWRGMRVGRGDFVGWRKKRYRATRRCSGFFIFVDFLIFRECGALGGVEQHILQILFQGLEGSAVASVRRSREVTSAATTVLNSCCPLLAIGAWLHPLERATY
jgi:hypothetical protein